MVLVHLPLVQGRYSSVYRPANAGWRFVLHLNIKHMKVNLVGGWVYLTASFCLRTNICAGGWGLLVVAMKMCAVFEMVRCLEVHVMMESLMT